MPLPSTLQELMSRRVGIRDKYPGKTRFTTEQYVEFKFIPPLSEKQISSAVVTGIDFIQCKISPNKKEVVYDDVFAPKYIKETYVKFYFVMT